MRIVYFTIAQDEKDYRSFMNKWKISLNSSNQNFHNKVIRALAINNQVDVVSVRPFDFKNTKVNRFKKETKTTGNITWHYISRSGGRIYKNLTIVPQIKRILNKLDLSDAIFVTDTINTSIVRAIDKIKEKYNRPILGICTDSPSNITGTKKSFTVYLLSHCDKYDGYIALTEGLKDLYNPNQKPSYIFEGLVEDRELPLTKEIKRPYFFFGGALLEKYGIYNLIGGFKRLENNDVDLYICGHHGDILKIKDEMKGYDNIKFLGLLPVNKVLEYEQHSLACINPRPFSEDFDRFSIPSKTLEYMSMGRPVISVKNTILMEKFPDQVIWTETGRKNDLKDAMQKVIDMKESEREKMGKELKNRVLKLYSLESFANNIQPFLLNFLKKDATD